MSKTEDGFYFECEPVEERGNRTKIKEVIELRYPNLDLKISKETKKTYLLGLFVIGIFFCGYVFSISDDNIYIRLGMSLLFLILIILLICIMIDVDANDG